MNKQALRKIYRNRRLQLSSREKDKFEDLMLIRFQQLQVHVPATIMTYSFMEKENEYDPQLVIDYCRFKNPELQLAVPVIDRNEVKLNVFAIAEETVFETNFYGIEEPVNGLPVKPESIDLVIVPLLSFDEKGNRVGYGKGYYDRFLKHCRKDTLKIGFSFFEAETAIEDITELDVKLDICICPYRTYHF